MILILIKPCQQKIQQNKNQLQEKQQNQSNLDDFIKTLKQLLFSTIFQVSIENCHSELKMQHQSMTSAVIKLQTDPELQLHFHHLKNQNPLGYHAIFIAKHKSQSQPSVATAIDRKCFGFQSTNTSYSPDQQSASSSSNSQSLISYYEVNMFSNSLLHLTSLNHHLNFTYKVFKSLNSKTISPIISRVQTSSGIFVVSEASEYTLADLVSKREGLTVYESVFYLLNLMEIMCYLKSRDCFLEKIDKEGLYLRDRGDMKMIMTFGLGFRLNTVVGKPLTKYLAFRKERGDANICPDLWLGKTQPYDNQTTEHSWKSNDEREKRTQSNLKNSKQKNISIDEVNSWNLGIFLFEILENKKPFKQKPDKLRVQIYGQKLQYKEISDPDVKDLIGKLLVYNPKQRLKFQLLYAHPLLKRHRNLPHIFPVTILSCPPSESYQIVYEKPLNIIENLGQKSRANEKIGRNQNATQQTSIMANDKLFNRALMATIGPDILKGPATNFEIMNNSTQKEVQNEKNPKTQKQIKRTDRSLSQTKIYIEQFVDISNIYGYGYQLNTGTIGFVYNDETELYLASVKHKQVIYCNENHQLTVYNYEKLPEQEQLKKKLYILEGYIKSIKKYKPSSPGCSTLAVGNTGLPSTITGGSQSPFMVRQQSQSTSKQKQSLSLTEQDEHPFSSQKLITVTQYVRLKNASMFQLSNDSIQVIFHDKISFLLTRNNIYIQGKNSDRYEKFQQTHEQFAQWKIRKRYAFQMIKKVFDKSMEFLEGSVNAPSNSDGYGSQQKQKNNSKDDKLERDAGKQQEIISDQPKIQFSEQKLIQQLNS